MSQYPKVHIYDDVGDRYSPRSLCGRKPSPGKRCDYLDTLFPTFRPETAYCKRCFNHGKTTMHRLRKAAL